MNAPPTTTAGSVAGAVAGGSERWFAAADVDPVPARPTAGVLGSLTAGAAAPRGAEPAGHTRDGAALCWLPVLAHLELAGLALTSRPGLRTVTLAPEGTDAAGVGLASAFCAHLVAVRAGRRRPGGPFVTSPTRPDVPHRAVRLPHLLTVTHPAADRVNGPASGDDAPVDGGPVDVVVWELLPAPVARRWLGAALPDQAFYEDHLTELLLLRGRVRAGELPDTPATRTLARALTDRYFSIRFAYQHHTLIRALILDLTRHRPPGYASGRHPSEEPA